MKNLKRTWFPLTLVFLFVFALSSCNEECPPCDDPKPVKAPDQIVTVEQAKEMYETYGKRRLPLIQRYEDSIDRRGYDDKMQQQKIENKTNEAESAAAAAQKRFDVTRYVYYEYDTIKKYMAYIEAEAEKAGVKISTLRFYLSNYPEQDLFPKDTAARVRQNSVFITPTIKEGDRDYAYFGQESAEGKLKMILLDDDLNRSKTQLTSSLYDKDKKSFASFLPKISTSKTSAAPVFFDDKSYTMNRGGGIPPPYN